MSDTAVAEVVIPHWTSAGPASDRAIAGAQIFIDAASELLPSDPVPDPSAPYLLAAFHRTLGDVVRAARNLRGVHQHALAGTVTALLGQVSPDLAKPETVEQTYFSQVERGVAPPSVRRLPVVAAALGFPPSSLVVASEAVLVWARGDVDKASADGRRAFAARVIDRFDEMLKGRGVPAALKPFFRPWVQGASPQLIRAFPAGVCSAIAQFRDTRGLSQAQLVERLRPRFEDVSRSSLSQLEAGLCAPSWKRLAGIAVELQIPLSSFMAAGERYTARMQMPRGSQIREAFGRVEAWESAGADPDAVAAVKRQLAELVGRLD